MCHKFIFLTGYRFSTLVRAFVLQEPFWSIIVLRCLQICKSCVKPKFNHRRRILYQVSTQYPLFEHCNLRRQIYILYKMEFLFIKCGL